MEKDTENNLSNTQKIGEKKMKIVIEQYDLENIASELSATPSVANAIWNEIDQIAESESEKKLKGTFRSKFNAQHLSMILESVLKKLSDSVYGIIENAEDYKTGGGD